jgi:hypothetical protein
MRTYLNKLCVIALSLAVGTAYLGCSDEKEPDDVPPDGLGGDGDGDGDGDEPNGDGDGDGDGDGEPKCVENPKTNLEFLNSCVRPGIESRVFNNVERLPSNYKPGTSQPLPPLL